MRARGISKKVPFIFGLFVFLNIFCGRAKACVSMHREIAVRKLL